MFCSAMEGVRAPSNTQTFYTACKAQLIAFECKQQHLLRRRANLAFATRIPEQAPGTVPILPPDVSAGPMSGHLEPTDRCLRLGHGVGRRRLRKTSGRVMRPSNRHPVMQRRRRVADALAETLTHTAAAEVAQ